MKLILSLLLICATATPAMAAPEKVYDRVMASETIRCGYINYPPHIIVDPVTKKISGISHDIVEAMRSNRVDAICTSFWQNPVEGRYVAFTMPLFYSAVGAYVRKDETRIKPDLSNLNVPAFSISGSDGAVASTIAQQDFPKAVLKSLPNMTDESQMLLEVSAGKADIAFIETYLGEKFIKANPGSLKNLVPGDPVRLFGNTFAIPMDDPRFKTMLDSALVQMLYGGRVDKIIRKYEEVPGGIYRVAKPYEAAK